MTCMNFLKDSTRKNWDFQGLNTSIFFQQERVPEIRMPSLSVQKFHHPPKAAHRPFRQPLLSELFRKN